jgi:hypothetical protein
VARYYRIDYHAQQKRLIWEEDHDKKALAQKLDGGYLLKTDRQDLTVDEIWRTYILLTRLEAAFRAMKSPLMERPIQLDRVIGDRSESGVWADLYWPCTCRAAKSRGIGRKPFLPLYS